MARHGDFGWQVGQRHGGDCIVDDLHQALELRVPAVARVGQRVLQHHYQPARVWETRIRIPGYEKAMIVLRAGVKNQLGLIG